MTQQQGAAGRVVKMQPRAEWESITPDLAAKILERNTANRTLSQGLVDRYAAEMRRDAWDEDNGETIKIAADGTVVDGQHRLWAVVESGRTIRFLVVRGVDRDSFQTIDIGKARTAGDLVGIAGIPSGNQVAAGAMIALAYRKKKITRDTKSFSSVILRSEQLAFAMDNREEFAAATRVSGAVGAKSLIGSGTATGLAFVIARHSKADNKTAMLEGFFRQLGEGIFDDRVSAERHPIRMLREKLLANKAAATKLPTGSIIAMTIKAWNSYVAKKPVHVVRFDAAETFPVVS